MRTLRAPCVMLLAIAAACASDPSTGGDAASFTDATVPPDARTGDDSSVYDAAVLLGDGATLPEDADIPPHDAAQDGGPGDGAPSYDVEEIADATHYLGTVDNGGGCSHDYTTYGVRPLFTTATRAPLFLYFPGTSFTSSDQSARGNSLAGRAVAEAMAKRGFVALSVDYDNTPIALFSDHQQQLSCLFAPDQNNSLLARACARADVDCSLGVATWGHSLGGYVAVMAYTYDARARAAWATGYGGNAPRTLPDSRFLLVNGEHDSSNGSEATLNASTGYPAGQCAGQDTCLRPDGSGWLIVRAAALRTPSASADHCWFDRVSCSSTSYVLDPAWLLPTSDAAFALERNADWLAARARTPL